MGVLPKPKDLKKKPKATAADLSAKRIHDLAVEENKLIGSVNSMKDEERTLRERLDGKLARMQEKHDEKVSAMREEVASLELRKAQALKPIHKQNEDLTKRFEECEKREREADKRANALTALEESARKTLQDAKHTDEMADKHLENAKRLVKTLDADKEELRRKNMEFDKEKAAWQKDVANREFKLAAREGDVSRQEMTFKTREDLIQQRGREVHDQKRAVDSGYAALKEAEKHVAKRKEKKLKKK